MKSALLIIARRLFVHRCMYYLGNLRLDQGRIAEARQCHQTSFDMYCKIVPPNFKTGLCWYKMATFFQRDGGFENAE